MNSKTKRTIQRTIAYVAVFVVATMGGLLGNTLADHTSVSNTSNLDIVNTSSNTKSATKVTKIAEQCSKSVVEIKTETISRDHFYGNYVSEGAGSGVIISKNGYIITNYHVLKGANSINVTLYNGEEYKAEYIGGDSQNDIAVLKINEEGLTPAIIGNSDNLIVGEDVLAIGNPLGELGGTVTDGIISSTSREIEVGGVTMELLQTSAAINPGNSGGGLFNMNGELIGVVNAKSSGSNIEGLGFAIPSNTAIDIAKKIVDAH